MRRIVIASVMVLAGCGGSDGTAGLFGPAAVEGDAGGSIAVSSSSSGDDAGSDSAPVSGDDASPTAGEDASDSALTPPDASDSAAPPEDANDSAPPEDASDATPPDPCAATIASAHAQGLNCGVYQGCPLGTCSGGALCGGSGTQAFNAPANVCGSTCADQSQSASVVVCTQNSAPHAWVFDSNCQYGYRITNGSPVFLSSTIGDGCVVAATPTLGSKLCCP